MRQMEEEPKKVHSPKSIFTPEVVETLGFDLLPETVTLVEKANLVIEGRKKLLDKFPFLVNLDRNLFHIEERYIYHRPRTDELNEMNVTFFEYSESSPDDLVDIYRLDFHDREYLSLDEKKGFRVRRHLEPDSFDVFDHQGRKDIWEEIDPEDPRFERAIGIALNETMVYLTRGSAKDLDRLLSFLEPAPEPTSE